MLLTEDEYRLPLSVSTILTGLLSQFYNFLMVIYCSDSMIGNYSIALNFSMLITFFTVPIATVLFPAFSKLGSEKEMEIIKKFRHLLYSHMSYGRRKSYSRVS